MSLHFQDTALRYTSAGGLGSRALGSVPVAPGVRNQ